MPINVGSSAITAAYLGGNALSKIYLGIQQVWPSAVWTPLQLFASGEQGAWYDPSDLTTLYQDAAGTQPVTAVEQPVGLMRDKSGRGNHAYQSTSSSRPVLSARVNQYLSTETLATQNVTTLAANYTLTFIGAGSITLSGTATGTYAAGTHTITCTAGTLTSTVSGTVTKADFRVANDGVNIPAYQRVNTATDYDTVGFPTYLRFDGVDDWLQTNSIDFTATGKMTVFAGVRKLSDAPNYMVFAEISSSINTNNGAFSIFTKHNDLNAKLLLQSRGTIVSNSFVTSSAYNAPVSMVVSGLMQIADVGVNTVRINGNQAASSTTSQGTGNYGNYPLYIGARGGTSLPFNGRLTQLIVRGAQSSTAQIEAAEAYVNTKTKAYA
jgi:hypothetical protein